MIIDNYNTKFEKIYNIAWPVSMLSECIEILAKRANYIPKSANVPVLPGNIDKIEEDGLNICIKTITDHLKIEADSVETMYCDLENMLSNAGPALILLPKKDEQRVLLLYKGNKRKLKIITPQNLVKKISLDLVRDVITYGIEAPMQEFIEQLLKNSSVPEERLAKSKKAILKDQLATKKIRGFWILKFSPGSNLLTQILGAKIPKYIFSIITTNIVTQVILLIGWFIIGRSSLTGKLDNISFFSFVLIMISSIPFQAVTLWSGNLMSLKASGIFKNRLLFGILQLEPEEIKHQGAGQFLSRVMESEAVESFALTGGIVAFISIIEIFISVVILKIGIGGWAHALAFVLWIIITFFSYYIYFKKSAKWIETYRNMTNDLVERMVGYRTRIAQEDENRWHDEEDQVLSKYFDLSEDMESTALKINSIIPNGWFLLGFTVFSYFFLLSPKSTGLIAISIGGMMFSFQALGSLTNSMQSIISFLLAWNQTAPLFEAASRQKDMPSAVTLKIEDKKNISGEDENILSAHDVSFQYNSYGRTILQNCNLKCLKGDRLLLEGPSGGGKSTLAALIAGLKEPESGILLLSGFDKKTMGTYEWKKKVVIAPQFHENHVFMETFAFNILMGRQWPPSNTDLEDAIEICNELGLGDLLNRMPAGLQQMVGESGWRLSHGEKSRLYIARALLQNSEFIILDESFAALDPENLYKTMSCVLKRASTLMVIAHP